MGGLQEGQGLVCPYGGGARAGHTSSLSELAGLARPVHAVQHALSISRKGGRSHHASQACTRLDLPFVPQIHMLATPLIFLQDGELMVVDPSLKEEAAAAGRFTGAACGAAAVRRPHAKPTM